MPARPRGSAGLSEGDAGEGGPARRCPGRRRGKVLSAEERSGAEVKDERRRRVRGGRGMGR